MHDHFRESHVPHALVDPRQIGELYMQLLNLSPSGDAKLLNSPVGASACFRLSCALLVMDLAPKYLVPTIIKAIRSTYPGCNLNDASRSVSVKHSLQPTLYRSIRSRKRPPCMRLRAAITLSVPCCWLSTVLTCSAWTRT